MKKYIFYISILALIHFLGSCEAKDDTIFENGNLIAIGEYTFNFTSDFGLTEEQGIDSYVGKVSNDNFSLTFDYGWYTRPSEDLPIDEYEVVEDVIDGHFRQIVKALDPESGYTSIHLFNIIDATANPAAYNSLTFNAIGIKAEEQAYILSVFSSVQID